MSHLTEYSILLAYVKRRLQGDEPATEKHGQFGGIAVQFPLTAVPSLGQVEKFYGQLHTEVENSRLQPERKIMYRKFVWSAYLAHCAVEKNQPRWGTVWHLGECVSVLNKALRLMEKSKEYDDGHPVHWSEVYRVEGSEHDTSPEEYWLLFKLESLLPVLRLSVRILRLILPDCSGTWNEWEDSLCRKEWLQQFILDSRKSSMMGLHDHAPRREDVVGSSSSGTH
jgi:hypothetical protein